jgi:hypothetical protein
MSALITHPLANRARDNSSFTAILAIERKAVLASDLADTP